MLQLEVLENEEKQKQTETGLNRLLTRLQEAQHDTHNEHEHEHEHHEHQYLHSTHVILRFFPSASANSTLYVSHGATCYVHSS